MSAGMAQADGEQLENISAGDIVARRGVDKQGDPYLKKAVVADVAETGDFISIKRYAPHTHPKKGLFSAEEWADSDWELFGEE